MAATTVIYRRTGAAGSPTDTAITSATTRLSLSDNPTPGNTTPILIPGTGSTFSYWMVTYLSCTTTPAGTIDTIKWYSSGTNPYPTGVTYQVATAPTYVQATGTATSGSQLVVGNYTGLVTAVNAFTFTSASSLAINGTITNPAVGKISDYIPQQSTVATGTTSGVTATSTYTMTYNET